MAQRAKHTFGCPATDLRKSFLLRIWWPSSSAEICFIREDASTELTLLLLYDCSFWLGGGLRRLVLDECQQSKHSLCGLMFHVPGCFSLKGWDVL